jgi:hypothetical protein
MSRSLRHGAFAVVLLAAAVGSGAAASPAHAALSCKKTTCNGKDPQLYGCAKDAETVNSTTFEDVNGDDFVRQVVELRYSKKCNASWARVKTTAGGIHKVFYGQAYMDPYKSTTKHIRYLPGSVYSNMRAGGTVNACGKSAWDKGATKQTNCTSAG